MEEVIKRLNKEIDIRRISIKRIRTEITNLECAIVELKANKRFRKGKKESGGKGRKLSKQECRDISERKKKWWKEKKKVESEKKPKMSKVEIAEAQSKRMKKYWAKKRREQLKRRGLPEQVVFGAEKRPEKKIKKIKKGLRERWTKDEDRMLLGMREYGYSWKQVATRIGRSYGAVWKRNYVLNNPVVAKGRDI